LSTGVSEFVFSYTETGNGVTSNAFWLKDFKVFNQLLEYKTTLKMYRNTFTSDLYNLVTYYKFA